MLIALLGACAHPHKVDVVLPESLPEAKTTAFSQAILDLGLMSEIYGAATTHVMAKEILDDTGANAPTFAEIPREITAMLRTTLNGIGGKVVFIPYDPQFVANSINTGYSGFDAKLIPNVVVQGGITEFDRGLELRGKNTDLGLEAEVKGIDLGFDYSSFDQNSLASITLDFNLIDFETLAGVPRMQAVNNIKVYKAQAEDSLGFSIQGNTLGLKGSVKKVQGRHAAVRLLVQLSMIQVIGKYLKLPYWRLLPEGEPDPVVIDSIKAEYHGFDQRDKLIQIQGLLGKHGYPVRLTGTLDYATEQALADFSAKNRPVSNRVSEATYLALYLSVPITQEALARRRSLMLTAKLAETPAKAPKTSEPVSPRRGINVATSLDNQLRVWTDSTTYRVGDALKISFQVTAPMHVRIVSTSSAGRTDTLFPNPYQTDDLLKPGPSYQMPPANAPFTLNITGPAGTDKIMAIASPQPIPSDLNVLTAEGEFTQEVQQTIPTHASLNITILDRSTASR